MQFVNDHFLQFLWLIPFLMVGFVLWQSKKRKLLSSIGDRDVVSRMHKSTSTKRQYLKYILRLLALMMLIIAIARPQYGFKDEMISRAGRDIVVVIDTSKSMLVEDIKPNRLSKAKHEVRSLIDKLKGDRIAIVSFAGKAFVQCPLTVDYSAASLFVDHIDTQSVPLGGTRLGDAIETGMKLFSTKEKKYKVMILITDGETHDKKALSLAKKANDQGVVIYSIGVGSVAGEPIPEFDDRGNIVAYKKNVDGKTVVSKLNEKILREIALQTEGMYYHATPAEFELDRIYKEIMNMDAREFKARMVRQYEDRYQYPLMLALLLLIIELFISERRKHA